MMLFIIVWMLIGFASGVHAIILAHRQLVKESPRYFSKDDNPFITEPIGVIVVIAVATLGGPVSLLTNLMMFGEECFK